MSPNRSFAGAVKWAYTGNWGERVCSSVATFILAGILEPQGFGLVAIAMVYVMFLQLFLDQGLRAALIQRKNLEPEHLDAVFWMDTVLGLLLVGISVLASEWWAARNHAPEAAKLISMLSLCIPIEALAVVQSAVLSRNMDFRALSISSNVAAVAGGGVGIAMAVTGCGVWALVGQQITKDLLTLIFLWRLSPWRPRFAFSWRHLKDLAAFSVSNFIAQLAIFGDTQSSAIFLGLLFGPVAVGLYRLADRVVQSVVAIAMTSIQAVSLPEFSRVQDRPEELRNSALTCIRLSSTMTLPALSGMAAVSSALMATLGPKWLAASDALRVLCIVGMCSVFASFTGPMLQAVSKPHYVAGLVWARMVLSAGLLVGVGLVVRDKAVAWQLMGIAGARFAVMVTLVTPTYLYILMRVARISMRALAQAVMPSAAASVSTVVAVTLFQLSGLLTSTRPIIVLTAESIAGGIVGLLVLLTLDMQVREVMASIMRWAFHCPALARELD